MAEVKGKIFVPAMMQVEYHENVAVRDGSKGITQLNRNIRVDQPVPRNCRISGIRIRTPADKRYISDHHL